MPAPAYIQALPREPEEAVEFLLLVLRGLRAACDSAGHAPGWGRDPLGGGNPFAAAAHAGASAHAAAQAALHAAHAAAAARRKVDNSSSSHSGGNGGVYRAHVLGGAHGVLRSGALVVPAKCRLRAAALAALGELLALDAPGAAPAAQRRMGDDAAAEDAYRRGRASSRGSAAPPPPPRRRAAPTGAVPLATARAWADALAAGGPASGPLAPFVRHGGVAELRAVVADASEAPEVRAAAAALLGSVAPAAADEATTTLAYLASEFVTGRRWRRHAGDVAAAAAAVAGLSPGDGLDAGRRAARLPGYARRAELALPMLMALDASARRGPFDDDEAVDADEEEEEDADDAGTAWGRRRSRAARLSVFNARPAFPPPSTLGGAHGALAAQTAQHHSSRGGRGGRSGALMPLQEEITQALRRAPGALLATLLGVLSSPTSPLLGAMAAVRPLAVRVAGARGGAFNEALAALAGAGAQPFPIGTTGPPAAPYSHDAAAAEDARLGAAALAGRLSTVRVAGALACARALLTAILSPPPPGRSGAGGALTLPPAAGRALAALIAGSRPEVAAAILAHAAPLLLPLAGASAAALSAAPGDDDAADAAAAARGGRGDDGGGGGGDADVDAAAARRGAADAALRAAAASAPVLQYVHTLLRAALAGAAPLAVRLPFLVLTWHAFAHWH
jgi:hypothetical protein